LAEPSEGLGPLARDEKAQTRHGIEEHLIKAASTDRPGCHGEPIPFLMIINDDEDG